MIITLTPTFSLDLPKANSLDQNRDRDVRGVDFDDDDIVARNDDVSEAFYIDTFPSTLIYIYIYRIDASEYGKISLSQRRLYWRYAL